MSALARVLDAAMAPLAAAVAAGRVPGGVLGIVERSGERLVRSVGAAQLVPIERPMTDQTSIQPCSTPEGMGAATTPIGWPACGRRRTVLNARGHGSGDDITPLSLTPTQRAKCSTPEGMGAATTERPPQASVVPLDMCSSPEGMGAATTTSPPEGTMAEN